MLQEEVQRGPDFLRLAIARSRLYLKDSDEKRLLDAMLFATPKWRGAMLTQAEADQLMQMTKRFVRSPARIVIPPGADDTYELAGPNDRERFLLDVWRGTLRLSKLKFQERVRTAIVLVRLDVDGAPHTNPDGQRLAGTHIHLFREGYDDRWAYPVDASRFNQLTDPGAVFQDFCALCNIESPPPVQGVIV